MEVCEKIKALAADVLLTREDKMIRCLQLSPLVITGCLKWEIPDRLIPFSCAPRVSDGLFSASLWDCRGDTRLTARDTETDRMKDRQAERNKARDTISLFHTLVIHTVGILTDWLTGTLYIANNSRNHKSTHEMHERLNSQLSWTEFELTCSFADTTA